ncbi:50S ribosomal protein L4 [Buchnera aphidicola]|uniref:50S ribosomal protein L4 n=1 Tax=Buchnera aphidicola TaxID=9 RepID=UPI0020929960|nr:50S ribosomal protein L4 [Buchnera aphidicola]USS94084.1 50S ribosomal protein L4 [Buchnera aphidicola (Sipha maydis)]
MEIRLKDTNEYVKLSKLIFQCSFNKFLVNQVLKSYLISCRQGTKAQKNRSEVSGSGKKPWRQKGTGRARVGSIRSPIWRSGGVTFAAKTRDYFQKINKKMYRGAMKCIFSKLISQKRLIVFKDFNINIPKTKILIKKLEKFDIHVNSMIIQENLSKELLLASRNLYQVKAIGVNFVNPVLLLKYRNILITLSALKNLEEKFS